MGRHISGTMKWDPWAPAAYAESAAGGPMLFRGTVANHYSGGIQGRGAQETLIVSQLDGSSSMVAMERVEGELDGRKGSFVLRLDGTVKPGRAEAAWTVVPGSGTGALSGLEGGGTYVCDDVGPNGFATYELDYEL